MIAVSIIGTDRFTVGYGAAKIAHEQAVLAGPIPAHVLRAAQFHEFVAQLVEWGTQGDVAYVQRMRTQLIAARAVAEVLVDLATRPELPETPFTEVAGPREESMVEAAALLAARRGHPAKIEGVTNLADPDHDLNENGALLPGPGAILTGPPSPNGSTRRPDRGPAATRRRLATGWRGPRGGRLRALDH